jgi:polysaccharide biosynthesis/export protein
MMKKLFLTAVFFGLILSTCGAQTADDTSYKVGVEDVLEINILQPEKSTSVPTVSSDGSISLPYIGNIRVEGMTLDQIQELIQQELSDGYMKYPLVSVSLKESLSKKFFISGSVAKPGAYTLIEKTTVFNAIAMAGGLSKYDPSSRVSILRMNEKNGNYKAIVVDVGAVMSGKTGADIILLPGDTVTVSEGKFFVYGEVNKPGVYSFEGDTTVLKAIAIAGGFTKFGSPSRVKILRPKENGSDYETIKINIKDLIDGSVSTDTLLKPQDTVVATEGVF